MTASVKMKLEPLVVIDEANYILLVSFHGV